MYRIREMYSRMRFARGIFPTSYKTLTQQKFS